ncbi:MAG TPA: cytochrome c oxidase assembly protein [Hyphomicrobiaceae bacterium]|jgi:cytochrome c oxidase assembly protein subunit 11|nr:cytochrome c oxidase assembly protein [Hyphomicrobiaceae bacterium]
MTLRTHATRYRPLQRRHRAIALWCAVLVVGMVGASYAAVPLYRLFCQVTGYDGTPRRAAQPSDRMVEKTVTVRFDGNVAPGLPWRFEPVENTRTVKLGENAVAIYRATNTSDQRIVATATYNILPEIAASYFNKLQCFCFTEQALEPGETAELALSFFIDPEIVGDKDARGVTHVTVSYTFYPVAAPGVAEKPTSRSG